MKASLPGTVRSLASRAKRSSAPFRGRCTSSACERRAPARKRSKAGVLRRPPRSLRHERSPRKRGGIAGARANARGPGFSWTRCSSRPPPSRQGGCLGAYEPVAACSQKPPEPRGPRAGSRSRTPAVARAITASPRPSSAGPIPRAFLDGKSDVPGGRLVARLESALADTTGSSTDRPVPVWMPRNA